jgi:hypothetical protein
MTSGSHRAWRAAAALILAAGLSSACGSSPSAPSPPPGNGGGGTPPPPPPANNPPVIESLKIQGTRPNEPANFADAGEAVPVTAEVKDAETPAAQLTYNWSATAGTFTGSGASVIWQAPPTADDPSDVTITLEVVEKYGTAPATAEHKVTSSAKLSLHDSKREVGEMARQFLLDFSDSSIRDVDYIMRNFGGGNTCPAPRDVAAEYDDVRDNRAGYRIVDYRIGTPRVTVDFGGTCPFRGKLGDACASVPAFWDSIQLSDNSRGAVEGDDQVTAAYSASDRRWWLCASDWDQRRSVGAALRAFFGRR